MPTETECSTPPRRLVWPIFFVGLLLLVNAIALAILYADVSLQVDGRLDAEKVRGAFKAMTKLNLLLGGLSLGSIFLRSRKAVTSERD